jgi:hypothetical protein
MENMQEASARKRLNLVDKARGEVNGMARLTAEKVKLIRSLSGSEKELATLFGVSPVTIGDVRRRKTWRHI